MYPFDISSIEQTQVTLFKESSLYKINCPSAFALQTFHLGSFMGRERLL